MAKGLKSRFEKLLPITKEKIEKLIGELINQAKFTDKKDTLENDRKKQIEIIEDAEKIMRINEIIGQINNKNVG